MAYLPLANILHHKLGSLLSALGIGIGVCMLVTLGGMSRGSLYEVAERWESVDADLIALPRIRQDVSMLTGGGLSDKLAEVLPQKLPGKLARVTPVFLWRMKLAGQDQMVAGVTNGDLPVITRHADARAGRARFEPRQTWGAFTDDLRKRQLADYTARNGSEEGFLFEPRPADLASGGWLELIIDNRLAQAGHYRVGDVVTAADHPWTLVGIVPAGGLARVYMPRQTAQYLFAGSVPKSTVLFIKLSPGTAAGPVARELADLTGQEVAPLDSYRAMLVNQFGILFVFVDGVIAVALTISFLFIMVTLYTMVLQRTRDIAILKSSGASNGFIVRQVMAESLLLTIAGAAMGVGLSFAAGAAITHFRPLLTVAITWNWIALAGLVALGGAAVSALYPAWRATRVDMLAALTYE